MTHDASRPRAKGARFRGITSDPSPPKRLLLVSVDPRSVRIERIDPALDKYDPRSMDEVARREALERHWSTAGSDEAAASEIYHEDCVVEWPQSGERIRGKANLRALREAYPAELTFQVRRILGHGELWITEYRIAYDDKPVHAVSIMEFRDDRVERETHYFADPFEPPEWRARWVESI